MLEARDGQGAIGSIGRKSTGARASPGTATQGVAQAACGIIFLGVDDPLPSSQPAIVDAIGAA
jgi:hypothetical protein